MTSAYHVTSSDFLGLLSVLAVTYAPVILAVCSFNRAHDSKPGLPECGHERALPESPEASARGIRLASHAADNTTKQHMEAHSTPASKAA